MIPWSADRVWQAVCTPRAMEYVAAGRLSFRPIDPPGFPDTWEEGEYVVALRGFGWFPLGTQVIAIHYGPGERTLTDTGRSRLFRRWDHRISVEPHGVDSARYTDRVEFDAGLLTALLRLVVSDFFRHRQRRWLELATADP